jgi:hypothetical protein
MVGFADLIAAGENVGLFDFYLPYILVFAIIYGVLEKASIFKKPSINIIISLVAALMIVAQTPLGPTMITFFTDMFGGTLTIIITIIAALMIFAVFMPLIGQDKPTVPGWMVYVFIILSALMAIVAYISSGGTLLFPGFDLAEISMPKISLGVSEIDLQYIFVALMIVGVIGMMAWLIKEDQPKKEKK